MKFLRFLFSVHFLVALIFAFSFLFLFSIFCNIKIKQAGKKKMYSDLTQIPYNETGLVLGASKELRPNVSNPYFRYRMQAAAELYHAGKVSHFIVSGDNSTRFYDEPTDMMNSLIQLGVPAHCITRDYAGFRTFDSVVRALKIFGQRKLTIVSQPFHNERALFICENVGIDAVAYNAKNPYIGPRSKLRECLARMNAVLDIYLDKDPKFLGEPIAITIQK